MMMMMMIIKGLIIFSRYYIVGSILAGADDSGQVVVWRLSTRLSSIQEGELALLESLGAVDDEDQKLQVILLLFKANQHYVM